MSVPVTQLQVGSILYERRRQLAEAGKVMSWGALVGLAIMSFATPWLVLKGIGLLGVSVTALVALVGVVGEAIYCAFLRNYGKTRFIRISLARMGWMASLAAFFISTVVPTLPPIVFVVLFDIFVLVDMFTDPEKDE